MTSHAAEGQVWRPMDDEARRLPKVLLTWQYMIRPVVKMAHWMPSVEEWAIHDRFSTLGITHPEPTHYMPVPEGLYTPLPPTSGDTP